jgi:hypothetical protein
MRNHGIDDDKGVERLKTAMITFVRDGEESTGKSTVMYEGERHTIFWALTTSRETSVVHVMKKE